MTDPLRDELAAALRQSVAEASDYRGDLDANLCIRLLATYGVTLTREPGLDERDPHFYSKALMRQGREPGHGSRVVTPLDVAWDALIDEGWVGFEAAKARHRPAIEAEARASLDVARVARGVWTWRYGDRAWRDGGEDERGSTYIAEHIAREYAALKEPTP